MKKKILSMSLIGMMATSILFGCGNDENTKDTENTTQNQISIIEDDKDTIFNDIGNETLKSLMTNEDFTFTLNGILKAENDEELTDLNLKMEIARKADNVLGELTLYDNKQESNAMSLKIYYPDINSYSSYYTTIVFNDEDVEWQYHEDAESSSNEDTTYSDTMSIIEDNAAKYSKDDLDKYCNTLKEYFQTTSDIKTLTDKLKNNFIIKKGTKDYTIEGTIKGEDLEEVINKTLTLFNLNDNANQFNISALVADVTVNADINTNIAKNMTIDLSNSDFNNLFADMSLAENEIIRECIITVEYENSTDFLERKELNLPETN